MGLQHLAKEIMDNASKEAQYIEEQAKQEASRELREAQKQADHLVKQAHKKAVEEAAQLKTGVSSAKLKAKKMVSEAKAKLVEESIEVLKKELKQFTETSEYEEFCKKLYQKAVAELGYEDSVIECSKKDSEFFSKMGKTVETNCVGGLALATASGKIRVNYTLDSLVEEKKDELRQKAFELLFKE